MASEQAITDHAKLNRCACEQEFISARRSSISNTISGGHAVSESPYILPSNATESIRLELQARHLCAIMGHQVVHSPIRKDEIRMILDAGCGTGFVTDSLGYQYPKATVYGLDLSPVPDVGRRRASNVQFLVGNVIDFSESSHVGHVLRREHFDLVFSRLLMCGMTDWPKYLATAFDVLRPGGWVELHEIDWVWWYKSANPGEPERSISGSWDWFQIMRAAAMNRGLDPWCGSSAASRLTVAGFEEVTVYEYYWPFGGAWERRPEMRAFGDYIVDNMSSLGDQTLARLLEGSGISDEKAQQMRDNMHKDLAAEAGKRWKFYVTIGRKPLKVP